MPALERAPSSSAAAAPPLDPSTLLTTQDKALLSATTTHEKLLVSQAVFEKGTEDFEAVAGLIRGHALIRDRGEGWFAPKHLAEIWAAQLHETGHEADSQFGPQDAELRKIAHHYYMMRVHELYAGMEACQDQFRIIFSELEELKAGKLDWKLLHPERAKPPSPAKVAVDLPALPADTAEKADEVAQSAVTEAQTEAPVAKTEEQDVEMRSEA